MISPIPEDEPVEPGGCCRDRFYFATPAELDAAFAARLVPNLKNVQTAFTVSLTARNNWIQVSSEPEPRTRVLTFLAALQRQTATVGRSLDQREFELILSACKDARENELQTYFAERVKVSPGKHDIAPRTRNQLLYLRAMRSKDIVFGIGPAGTGKTFLAMAMAVSALLAHKCERIILTRPAVEAGENLGFLPGKLEEKINPYLRPLYDALYDMLSFSEAESLIEHNIIEVAPMAFMRGRTLNNAFVILDEAQNTTNEQMLMFLTRLGFHSQCVVCGDPTQTDLPRGKTSGLALAVERLRSIDEIAICHFSSSDVIRHSLVEKIINAYADPRPCGAPPAQGDC